MLGKICESILLGVPLCSHLYKSYIRHRPTSVIMSACHARIAKPLQGQKNRPTKQKNVTVRKIEHLFVGGCVGWFIRSVVQRYHHIP